MEEEWAEVVALRFIREKITRNILKEKEKRGKNLRKKIEEKGIKGKIREYKGVTYHDLKRRIKIFKIT